MQTNSQRDMKIILNTVVTQIYAIKNMLPRIRFRSSVMLILHHSYSHFSSNFGNRGGSPSLGNESSAEGIVQREEASFLLQQPSGSWTGTGGRLPRFHIGPCRHSGSCYSRSSVCFQYKVLYQQTSCQRWSSFPISKKCVITPTSRCFQELEVDCFMTLLTRDLGWWL